MRIISTRTPHLNKIMLEYKFTQMSSNKLPSDWRCNVTWLKHTALGGGRV